MTRREIERLDEALTIYMDELIEGLGRRERKRAMRLYVTGLLLDGERKSIEPMAMRLMRSKAQFQAVRQRMQECVSVSPWPDDELLQRLALKFERDLPGIEAFVIDDTGFIKKGTHSVGVGHQYTGTHGGKANCQVATSLHLAGKGRSGCIGFHLYLPEEWANDPARRKEAGIPDDVTFKTKPEIALERIQTALAWGVRKHVVLADAAYGSSHEFRDGLDALGLRYAVGVAGSLHVWPPGSDPKLMTRQPGGGRPPTRTYVDDRHPRLSIAELANQILEEDGFVQVTWRQGAETRASYFAAVRVRTATERCPKPGEEQWLLCEYVRGEKEPFKYHLSTLPADTSLVELVRVTRLRWRVEQDYEELKGEVGLDHFEGRKWRGFHHHTTLCALAHGFLALQRALSPPEQQEAQHRLGPSTDSAHPEPAPRLLPGVPTAHP